MPELPEVETVVRTLENRINGRIINEVVVRWPKIIDNVPVDIFEKKLRGQKFIGFGRRGKFLLFELSNYMLIAHLRMEGKFYVYAEETEPDKHSHVIFRLDKGELHFNDVRKFGRLYLYEKNNRYNCLDKLGKEPWDDTLTAEYLKEYCKGKSTAIKSQLLDQSMIAGIGNIYANEICFDVRINPEHPACYISRDKWNEIIESTRKILAEAIRAGGTTIRSYTSSLGVTGLFQQELFVQSREKEPCKICGQAIEKKFVNGRGTYFCPECQKKKPLRVAITGNIGTGKSTVSALFMEEGYPVISCDEVNRELLEKESTRKHLAGLFNCDYSQVNKAYIRERIFADEKMKKKVEEYLHNCIWNEVEQFYQSNKIAEMVVTEVPLLFETDWYRHFDCNVLVVSDKKDIVQRLMNDRHMSEEEIEKILQNQMPDDAKISMADAIIKNEGSIEILQKNVKRKITEIIRTLPQE
ncbi:MAG: bifunctional DNA-formamidopyrimidine glycosylase/DNA-(apurinic or apyrimidinic site) lyase [Erysipelotrichaceae bacterium]|nr:bifunctional DNA-formamidopyrimidine glycosylase/DNA-(apurinic or apyrimidinic site) lyase [Erysipelotrichaceae bacterium]